MLALVWRSLEEYEEVQVSMKSLDFGFGKREELEKERKWREGEDRSKAAEGKGGEEVEELVQSWEGEVRLKLVDWVRQKKKRMKVERNYVVEVLKLQDVDTHTSQHIVSTFS
jgi:hypothetical protein